MAILKDNWFLKPTFDFESKSYQILGYTQYLNSHFANWRFFPYIDGLQRQLAELSAYQVAKVDIEGKLQRDIESLDLKNKKIIKAPVPDSSGLLEEIEQTLAFAEEHLQTCYTNGYSEFENAKKEIQISPIGLTASNPTNGLILFRNLKQMRVYSYSLRMVMRPDSGDKYKDLRTNYLTDIRTGIIPDLHQIKWSVIRSASLDIGTNAYLVDCNQDIPHFETVLPVVKSYLIEGY